MLLAGVSALAMLACVAEADAETFMFTGVVQSFPVAVSGEYSLDVFGASGGSSVVGGGLGAEVSGDIVLTAGETLTLFVGGRGQNGSTVNDNGGGGGGFVFLGTSVLAVAGGGGGAGVLVGVGSGQAGTAGGAGAGASGGAGGASGSGGGGGTYTFPSGAGFNGGGGAGVASGAAGDGGDGAGKYSGSGAKFPNGGAGGGGGGAGGFGGGGAAAIPEGAGAADSPAAAAAITGAARVPGRWRRRPRRLLSQASLFTSQVLTAGGALAGGDGSIDIELLKAVPEPSTWAMTLAGFAGLGWLTHMRRRKASPA